MSEIRLIDANELKNAITEATYNFEQMPIRVDKVMQIIDNAPTVEIEEPPFVMPVAEIKCDFTEEDKQKFLELLRKERPTLTVLEPERPQGKWEEPFERNGKSYHKCTNCHISSELILIDKFCPNCGADMRGGAE